MCPGLSHLLFVAGKLMKNSMRCEALMRKNKRRIKIQVQKYIIYQFIIVHTSQTRLWEEGDAHTHSVTYLLFQKCFLNDVW